MSKHSQESSTPRDDARKWFCTNADDYRIPTCSKQCEQCWRADNQEKADAQAFRDNMERECKP